MSGIMSMKVATDVAAGTAAGVTTLSLLMDATMNTMAALTTVGSFVLIGIRLGLALREWRNSRPNRSNPS